MGEVIVGGAAEKLVEDSMQAGQHVRAEEAQEGRQAQQRRLLGVRLRSRDTVQIRRRVFSRQAVDAIVIGGSRRWNTLRVGAGRMGIGRAR
jgi:hypothetical protein